MKFIGWNTLAVFSLLYVLPACIAEKSLEPTTVTDPKAEGDAKGLPKMNLRADAALFTPSPRLVQNVDVEGVPKAMSQTTPKPGSWRNNRHGSGGSRRRPTRSATTVGLGNSNVSDKMDQPAEVPEKSQTLLKSAERDRYTFAKYQDTPLSCPLTLTSCAANGGNIDECCTPKYGELVLAMSWSLNVGPTDKFTVHGLWPNKCPGKAGPPQDGCSTERNITTAEDVFTLISPRLRKEMDTMWLARNGAAENHKFWRHEWNKHGTCLTTLEPKCFTSGAVIPMRDGKPIHDAPAYKHGDDVRVYFRTALDLAKKYDAYIALKEAGILPGKEYTIDHMARAIRTKYGMGVRIKCDFQNPTILTEIEFHFIMKGMDTFIPVNARFQSPKYCKDKLMWKPKTVKP